MCPLKAPESPSLSLYFVPLSLFPRWVPELSDSLGSVPLQSGQSRQVILVGLGIPLSAGHQVLGSKLMQKEQAGRPLWGVNRSTGQ